MTEREKPDLSKIEPIGPVPDLDDARIEQEAERSERVGAAVSGAPPAVGVEVDRSVRDAEPRTSPETEVQLDQLRRG